MSCTDSVCVHSLEFQIGTHTKGMHTDGIHLHYIVLPGFDLITDIRTCWAASSQLKIVSKFMIEDMKPSMDPSQFANTSLRCWTGSYLPLTTALGESVWLFLPPWSIGRRRSWCSVLLWGFRASSGMESGPLSSPSLPHSFYQVSYRVIFLIQGLL